MFYATPFHIRQQCGLATGFVILRVQDDEDIEVRSFERGDHGAAAVGTRQKRIQDIKVVLKRLAHVFLSCRDRLLLQIRDLQIEPQFLEALVNSLGHGDAFNNTREILR